MARNPLKSELDEIKVLKNKKSTADLELEKAKALSALASSELMIAYNKLRTECSIDNEYAVLDQLTGSKWVLRGQTKEGQVKEIPLVEPDKKLKVVEQPKEDKVIDEKAAN